MPRAGDVLANRYTGQTIRVLRTAADTGGTLLELESTWAPGVGGEPPAHLHPRQAERITVLAGTLRVRLGDALRDVRAGQSFHVPAGLTHGMWNAGDVPATARWEVRPALATAEMLAALHGLAARGAVDAHGVPGLLDLAVLLRRHRDEFRLARPAPLVQAVVFGGLGALGRALGRGRPEA